MYRDAVHQAAGTLRALSDAIWDHPEIAFHETFAAQTLSDCLRDHGFAVQMGVYGLPTAFRATYGQGRPVIALLAEYDALSGLSQQADTFTRSPAGGGNGHGCGHHALGVAVVGAALGVQAYLRDAGVPGTVIVYGCPGEEGGSGKSFMVRDGAFDGVDCALCWHPDDTTGLFTGYSLANRTATYDFHGVSAHAGGAPHLGRSALDAVELMSVGVNYLREHIPQEARIHYAVTNTGGTSPNVVQADASVYYYFRAPLAEQVLDIQRRVDDIARGAALMTGTTVTWVCHKGTASLLPSDVMNGVLAQAMRETPYPTYTPEEMDYADQVRQTIDNPDAGFDDMLRELSPEARQALAAHRGEALHTFLRPLPQREPMMYGSTDVGDVSQVCPVGQINVATYAAGTPGHSWQMVAQGKSSILHKGMLYAAEVLAAGAVALFAEPSLIDRAEAERVRRQQGRPYVSLMPPDAKPQFDR